MSTYVVTANRPRRPTARLAAAVRCARRRRAAGPAGVDRGMTTAEYAVGTIAACSFAGVLLKVLTSPAVLHQLEGVIERALTLALHG